jgi:hypothetical protein
MNVLSAVVILAAMAALVVVVCVQQRTIARQLDHERDITKRALNMLSADEPRELVELNLIDAPDALEFRRREQEARRAANGEPLPRPHGMG